jgi:hypothetical protein
MSVLVPSKPVDISVVESQSRTAEWVRENDRAPLIMAVQMYGMCSDENGWKHLKRTPRIGVWQKEQFYIVACRGKEPFFSGKRAQRCVS